MEHYFQAVQESADFLKKKIPFAPGLAVVLSGGLDSFVEALQDKTVFSSADIPHFPKGRAEGHAGRIVFGRYNGVALVTLQGRSHYYEGLSPQEVVFPYFVLQSLGTRTVITTNAVGGIRHDCNVGDLLVVTDHINMMGTNPLIHLAVQKSKNQFTSLQDCYDPTLIDWAKKVAVQQKIILKEGVYLATFGPSYETRAEIRAFRAMGADTVGMSTVFEVIAARFLEMKGLTLNIITNPAADRHTGVMRHQEVLEAVGQVQSRLVGLLQGVVEKIGAAK